MEREAPVMVPLRLVRVALVSALVVATAGAASGAPVVTGRWRAPRQIAAVAVDDSGTSFAVDENTDGALVLRAYGADGTQRWHRSWRPVGAQLRARDVALGPNGTVLVTGTIRPDPTGRCDEIWSHGWAIAVWDKTGNPVWQRAERGWRTCKAFATVGSAVAGGGHTIAMVAAKADEYSVCASVLAFDLHGRLRWRYAFLERGSGHQRVNDLAVGKGGAVYLTGTFNVQTLDEPPTDQEALLEKLHSDGTLAWRRIVPDPKRRDEWAGDVTLAGGAVSFASLSQHARHYRARVASYSTGGTLRWERFLHPVMDSGWGDGFVAAHLDETLLAASRRDADGRRYILLAAYASNGTRSWTERLYRGANTRSPPPASPRPTHRSS
jgi:outer membrane protein assembly factor BamB